MLSLYVFIDAASMICLLFFLYDNLRVSQWKRNCGKIYFIIPKPKYYVFNYDVLLMLVNIIMITGDACTRVSVTKEKIPAIISIAMLLGIFVILIYTKEAKAIICDRGILYDRKIYIWQDIKSYKWADNDLVINLKKKGKILTQKFQTGWKYRDTVEVNEMLKNLYGEEKYDF